MAAPTGQRGTRRPQNGAGPRDEGTGRPSGEPPARNGRAAAGAAPAGAAPDAAGEGGPDEPLDAPKYHERALLRGLQILTSFSVREPELDLTTLSRRLRLPKGTLVRLLDCLKFAGFVEADHRSGVYRLGLRALEVGSVYQQTATLDGAARPVLVELAQGCGQSTNLGVLDEGQVIHVVVVAAPSPLRYDAYVGMRADAHCTGLGKALLAGLSGPELDAFLEGRSLPAKTPKTLTTPDALRAALLDVRRRGYALDDEETLPGLRCVAAPVQATDGTTIAAVSASGPRTDFEGQRLESTVAAVRAAAAAVARSPRCQVPGARCQVPGPRCQVPGPRCQVPGPRSQVSGPKAQVRDRTSGAADPESARALTGPRRAHTMAA
ncbi:MAG TPA: IclR family transcriptional regulator [Chloroflexota bacterium]|nr:IclR family transcriptional regulator [Chloroflexota bacterium]